jgi:hypothetical protein
MESFILREGYENAQRKEKSNTCAGKHFTVILYIKVEKTGFSDLVTTSTKLIKASGSSP